MWRSPGLNEDLLKRFGCLEDIYNAMRSHDLADVVYTALDVIKKTGSVPLLLTEKKSDAKSTEFRKLGNQAYMKKKYHDALVLYNKALKYAPNKSLAMKLAFSNRSALFITVKAYSACIDDLDTCFEMGCPPEIKDKLNNRYGEALESMGMDGWMTTQKFAIGYFKMLNEPQNPQISSATMDVGVIIEDSCPKIVAARDVKVGTVLAVERAYVVDMNTDNLNIACYNCQKYEYNLIPCEGCCHVMFCDDICMKECMNQYHSVECKIIDLFETTGCMVECTERMRLAIKAAIRMKLHSRWEKLIPESKVLGMDRIKNSSINQIYDCQCQENLSLLSFKENRNFIYGTMYNASFILAAVLCYMAKTNFLPYDYKERQEAIKCLGRIMMYLTLYGSPTIISDAASINNSSRIEFHDWENFGLFPLVGKLRNSCRANTLTVGLNDRVALVALEPISRGTEITITYLGHWLDKGADCNSVRNRNMYVLYTSVCNCTICSGDWQHQCDTLTPTQLTCFRKLNLHSVDFKKISGPYKLLCRALAELRNVPFSPEYTEVYKVFRECVLHLQQVNTENVVIEKVRAKETCAHVL
ncbi:SET and MYND domain-containing protein 4-like isoform X2 [Leguminivora glycinivorella]|nr:SET and MYND domain-containing protein 4-like isoform X2 [Leguminivora glycinivorella]XP_047992417.1 SET and MYND domain-containing protein 4-like isoform X2 [Leguminivora glycinivorella]